MARSLLLIIASILTMVAMCMANDDLFSTQYGLYNMDDYDTTGTGHLDDPVPPIDFGPAVNDISFGEEHPCLSPDNQRLFFCRRGAMLNDIRVSQKVDNVWQPSVALPSPPNNWPRVAADEDPCLAIDGRTLWFRQAD